MADELYDDEETDEVPESVTLSKKEHDKLAAQARRAAKLEEEAQSAEAAKRELLFLKAGIDTDSKLGKLMLKSYDGDMTVDALKAEAQELGLIAPPTEAPAPDYSPEEMASTDQRATLANGALADQLPPVDSKVEALRLARDAIAQGAPEEDGLAVAFRTLASDKDNWVDPFSVPAS